MWRAMKAVARCSDARTGSCAPRGDACPHGGTRPPKEAPEPIKTSDALLHDEPQGGGPWGQAQVAVTGGPKS